MTLQSMAMRDALKTLLEAAGAENVYTEDPKLVDWDEAIGFIRQQDRQFIQCWVLRRVGSIPKTSESHHGQVPIGCQVFWEHTFNVMLFFGYVEGTSEDQMQTLIDQVLSYMQVQRTLTDTAFGVKAPLALSSVMPRELGGVGGWEATFTITAEEHQMGLTMV